MRNIYKLSAIFDEDEIEYSSQAVTVGNRKQIFFSYHKRHIMITAFRYFGHFSSRVCENPGRIVRVWDL